jgi:hypothetical protein
MTDQAKLILGALIRAAEICGAFFERYNREPTEAEYKIALTLVIEAQRQERMQSQPQQAGQPQRDASSDDATQDTYSACPDCGGNVWDNRNDKGKAIWKCKDRDCGWAIWRDPKLNKRRA